MKTTIFVVPFALFGNEGTCAGAQLIADALREMLADNRRETRPNRSKCYQKSVQIKEMRLDSKADYDRWHQAARRTAAEALDAGEFLIWVGGNHLSVLPLYEELGASTDSTVVQFDAHLDVYHLRDCKSDLSHGNFLRQLTNHRPAIVNVGHRDVFLTREEINRYFVGVQSAVDVAANIAGVREALVRFIDGKNRLAVDIDWDVIDPAFFPAVGDPLPFGLTPHQLLQLSQPLINNRLAALAISEFDAGRDDRNHSMELAVWFVEQVLLWRYELL